VKVGAVVPWTQSDEWHGPQPSQRPWASPADIARSLSAINLHISDGWLVHGHTS